MEKKGGKISPPGAGIYSLFTNGLYTTLVINVEKGGPFDHPENKKITFNVDFRAHKNNVLYIRSTLNVIQALRFQL